MEIQKAEMLAPLHPSTRMELIRAVRHHVTDWMTIRVTMPPKNAKRQAQRVVRLNYRTNDGEKGYNSSRMAWYVVGNILAMGRTPEQLEAAVQERLTLIREFLEANAILVEIERRDK